MQELSVEAIFLKSPASFATNSGVKTPLAADKRRTISVFSGLPAGSADRGITDDLVQGDRVKMDNVSATAHFIPLVETTEVCRIVKR